MTDTPLSLDEILDRPIKKKNLPAVANQTTALPVTNTSKGELVPVTQTTGDPLIDDFEYVRDQLKSLLANGQITLENAMDMAKEQNNPRAYEVISGIIKNLSEVAQGLIDSHKTKKDASAGGAAGGHERGNAPPQASQSIRVEKAVFVGTATELLDRVIANEHDDEPPKQLEHDATDAKT